MKARCPKNPEHKRFITVAHVTEDWIVDEHGDFIEVAENPDTQLLHGPDTGNTWQCEVCGTEAIVEC
jgi:hypothetical protein